MPLPQYYIWMRDKINELFSLVENLTLQIKQLEARLTAVESKVDAIFSSQTNNTSIDIPEPIQILRQILQIVKVVKHDKKIWENRTFYGPTKLPDGREIYIFHYTRRKIDGEMHHVIYFIDMQTEDVFEATIPEEKDWNALKYIMQTMKRIDTIPVPQTKLIKHLQNLLTRARKRGHIIRVAPSVSV